MERRDCLNANQPNCCSPQNGASKALGFSLSITNVSMSRKWPKSTQPARHSPTVAARHKTRPGYQRPHAAVCECGNDFVDGPRAGWVDWQIAVCLCVKGKVKTCAVAVVVRPFSRSRACESSVEYRVD